MADVSGFGISLGVPVLTLVLIILAIGVIGLIVGGLILPQFINMVFNWYMWLGIVIVLLATVIVSGKAPSNKAMLAIGVIFGFMLWGVGLYYELQAQQATCAIPIIGGILCAGINAVSFVGRIFGLAVTVGAALVVVHIEGLLLRIMKGDL